MLRRVFLQISAAAMMLMGISPAEAKPAEPESPEWFRELLKAVEIVYRKLVGDEPLAYIDFSKPEAMTLAMSQVSRLCILRRVLSDLMFYGEAYMIASKETQDPTIMPTPKGVTIDRRGEVFVYTKHMPHSEYRTFRFRLELEDDLPKCQTAEEFASAFMRSPTFVVLSALGATLRQGGFHNIEPSISDVAYDSNLLFWSTPKLPFPEDRERTVDQFTEEVLGVIRGYENDA